MVEDNARTLAAENELKKFGLFADEYVNRLDGLCNLNPKERSGPDIGEWCSWDCDQNIILTNCSSHEYGADLGSLCGVGSQNSGAAVDNIILSKG